MNKLFSEIKPFKEKEDFKEKDKEVAKDKHDKNEKNEKEKSEKDTKDKEQKDSKDKEQKDQKDQKEQKDTKEGKDTKDQKDKEDKNEKQEKEKHEKEFKDRKEDIKEKDKDQAKEKEHFKDLEVQAPHQGATQATPATPDIVTHKFIEKFIEKWKDFKSEKIEFKEHPDKAIKDKDGYEGFGGFGFGGDPGLAQRVAGLEATVAQLVHFIPANLRPDLSAGALSQEADESKAPAEPAHKTEPPAEKGKK